MDRRTFLALAGAGAVLGVGGVAESAAASRPPVPGGVVRSAAAATAVPETVTVPLRVIDIGGVGRKVGIEIRLGGGEPRLYTFDTGSSGFYAARSKDWWPSYKMLGGPQIVQSYGSDEMFQSRAVRTTVGIPTTTGEIEVETEVGQVLDASGGSLGPWSRSPWRKDVAAGRPPLFGHFYGDFGSGLRQVNGLFAVLPQLPGNLSSGFAVSIGCGGKPSASPALRIGLTDAIRAEATSWIPMNGGPHTPPFPLSGRPTYEQSLVAGHFAVTGAATRYDFSTHAILDTGGGTTRIHEHAPELKVPGALLAHDGGRLASGVGFRVTAAGTEPGNGLDLGFAAGDVADDNQVLVSASSGGGYVNLGLIPFFRYTVVFDVERGLVGFAPCAGA